MTPQLAYLRDVEIDYQGLATDRFFVDFYTKYESSPQIDDYGQGAGSSIDDLASYTLRTRTSVPETITTNTSAAGKVRDAGNCWFVALGNV